MNDLIEVGKSHIAGAEVQTANARDLHAFLGVGKDFSSWIKAQIALARLVECRDYTCSPSKESSPSGAKHTIEYHLTLDAGKQVAMMSEIDKGFQVRDYFIECERRALAAPVDPLAGLPPEQRALVAVMMDNAAIKAAHAALAATQVEQAGALTEVRQRVTEMADTMLMLARPAGAESIVHIRARINELHGLPARIIDEVMRQSPIAPKPAGMVRHARKEAQGASYAVYWTKDVSAVFVRFVSECTHVTATQAAHPYIAGRFKLTTRAGSAA
jgi:phage anti-repressor protein